MKKLLLFLFCFSVPYQTMVAQTVGIGTTAPDASAQLDISSVTKGLLIPRLSTAQRNAIATPANGLMVYDINLSAFYYYKGTSWTAMNTGAGANAWAAIGTSIYNLNTGNIGIGTSAPGSKLHLVGDLYVENGHITIDKPESDITFKAYDAIQGFVEMAGGNHSFRMGTSAGNTTGQVVVMTQSSPRLTVTPEGDVGIGNAYPAQRLDVLGNIRSRKNLYADSNIRANNNISAGGTLSGDALTVGNNMVVGGSGILGGDLMSYTSLTINNANAVLTLKSGGTDKGFVQLSGDDLRVGTYSGNSTGKFLVRTGGANRMAVTSGGDIGFGTEDPQAYLHVNSGAQNSTLRLQSDNFPSLLFYQGTNSLGSIVGGADFFNITSPGKLMRLNTSLVIDGTTFNVGIGTSTPEEKLHVAGPVRVSELHRQETGNFNLVPVCYGRVSNLGTLLSGTPNITEVTHQAQNFGGYYQIRCPQVTTSSVVQVTIAGQYGASAIPVVNVSNGFLQIKFFIDFGEFDFSDNDVIGSQVSFHFVVFNP